MSEQHEADILAERLLNEPNVDPDDDLRMLSRQLLRRREFIENLKEQLAELYDPTLDLVRSSIDEILKKHREAVVLIRNDLQRIKEEYEAWDKGFVEDSTIIENTRDHVAGISAILDALNLFHPMYPEAFPGWPTK